MPVVLFYSRDPGPTNQLLAVRARLADGTASGALEALGAEATGCRIEVHARGPAIAAWRREGIEPLAGLAELGDGAILRLMAEREVRSVVTGTSDIDEPTDRRLWRLARAHGARSHVFLDHPANLDRRFFESTGELVAPDRIYAPDEGYRAPLAALGLAPGSIAFAGDLHLARLSGLAAAIAPARLAALRASWSAHEGERVLMFVSECNAEMAAAGRPSTQDEFAALDRLIGLVRRGVPIAGVATAGAPTRIVVRPHPRDRAGKYDRWRSAGTPPLVVSDAGGPIEAVLAADAIVGMDSTLLREAAAIGRPVASLTGTSQPGIARLDD